MKRDPSAVFGAILILTALGLCVFGLRAAIKADGNAKTQADQRVELAKQWSGDSAQFITVGNWDDTLMVILPDEDNAKCDAYVDSVAYDKKISKELEDYGFTSIRCLNRVEILK